MPNHRPIKVKLTVGNHTAEWTVSSNIWTAIQHEEHTKILTYLRSQFAELYRKAMQDNGPS